MIGETTMRTKESPRQLLVNQFVKFIEISMMLRCTLNTF